MFRREALSLSCHSCQRFIKPAAAWWEFEVGHSPLHAIVFSGPPEIREFLMCDLYCETEVEEWGIETY